MIQADMYHTVNVSAEISSILYGQALCPYFLLTNQAKNSKITV